MSGRTIKSFKNRTKLSVKEAVAGYLFALPSLLGFTLFFLAPFAGSLYYCFTRGIGGTEFAGFENFLELFQSKSFILAAENTLVFNSISVPLIIIVSLAFALLLNRKLKGLEYFRSFFILPLVIPVASVILVWQILFDYSGPLNKLLESFGLQPAEWMRSGWSVMVLTLLYVWKNCGYNVVLFLAALGNIPGEYYEAARVDGAGRWLIFRKITVPFVIPTGFFVFIISFINSLKVFREAYLMAGNYPYLKIYMLQHFMNNNFFNLSYQRLSASAFLLFAVIFLLVFVLFKIEARFERRI